MRTREDIVRILLWVKFLSFAVGVVALARVVLIFLEVWNPNLGLDFRYGDRDAFNFMLSVVLPLCVAAYFASSSALKHRPESGDAIYQILMQLFNREPREAKNKYVLENNEEWAVVSPYKEGKVYDAATPIWHLPVGAAFSRMGAAARCFIAAGVVAVAVMIFSFFYHQYQEHQEQEDLENRRNAYLMQQQQQQQQQEAYRQQQEEAYWRQWGAYQQRQEAVRRQQEEAVRRQRQACLQLRQINPWVNCNSSESH
jgi:uncharacterized protein YxeA